MVAVRTLRRAAAVMLTIGACTTVWYACSDLTSESPTSPAATPTSPPLPPPDLRGAMAAQGRHTDKLLAIPGVVGTAVGYLPDGQVGVQVLLERAGVRDLPKSLDGIPVAPFVTGRFMAFSDPTQRARPAPLGFSVGHPLITAGTIGARVKDATGHVYILSNNHVLANSNGSTVGDAIYQPGPFDGGSAADQIATLSDFQTITFSQTANNTMDAAIAVSNTGVLDNATPSDDAYGLPNSTIWGDADHDGLFDDRNALLGLHVQKYGRTTRLTHGTITGVNATVQICYQVSGISCTKFARYIDQLIITPGGFSNGGDSGSLIVTDDDNLNPVALLFAGSSSQTIGNRIDLVLNRFGVTIDGLDPPPPGPFTDLAVTNVTAPASVVRDETVTVTVRVRNFGNQDVPAFDVVLDDSTDGVTVGTQSVAALPPGTATTLSFTWTPASAGEHVLIGRHTLTDDRALNDQSGATVAVQAPLVDIGVVSISAPGGVSEGKTINVAVTVRNVGNQHVGDTFDVSLDNTTLGLSLGTQTVNGLAAGAGALLTFTWNTTGVPLGSYTLVASQHLSDGNAANDQQSFVVNVNPKLLDVAVANITGPPSVNQGAVAHFGVTLQNAGERDVLDTFTVVLTDATNGGALLATQSVPGLALGASSTLDLAWNTAGAAITGHTVIATQTLPDGNATNNARAIGILVKPPVVADVAVTAVNAPTAVSQGNTAAVQVTIQNIGQAASGSFDLVLTDSTAGMTIGTQTIASLGVNAATTLTFNWNTTGAALGSHALVAAHNLSDASAANNQRTATVTVNPRVVDVAVSAMTAPGSASQGSTVAVGVTVQNVGADPVTTGFAVTVTDATSGAAVGTQTVNSLAAGASVTLTFPWNTTGAVLGAHTLVATHDFADANASNNQRQVTVNVTAGVTDIALTNLTGPASVTQGDTAHFGVTVQNTGSQPVTTSFDVVLTDGTNGNAVVGIQTVAGLATGAVATLDFPWPTASVTATGHTIIARQMLADANGSNNSRAIGITVSPPSVHAGNIAATAVSNGSSWAASVEITVHDSRHNLVDGVVVRGSWGGPNVGECVTGSGGVAGKCTITYSPIPNTTFLVSFAVTSLTCTGYVYKPASNHDPDGSSNGTTVFVRRP